MMWSSLHLLLLLRRMRMHDVNWVGASKVSTRAYPPCHVIKHGEHACSDDHLLLPPLPSLPGSVALAAATLAAPQPRVKLFELDGA